MDYRCITATSMKQNHLKSVILIQYNIWFLSHAPVLMRITCAELCLSCCLVRSDSSLFLTSLILGIVPEFVSNLSRTRAFLLHPIQMYDNVRKTLDDAIKETHNSHDMLNMF
jgi:hypothetical protein